MIKKNYSDTRTIELSLREFSAGVYVVKLFDEKHVLIGTGKILKE